jgi:hypothetical protein
MASNESSNFQGFYRNLHTPAVLIGAACVLVALLISLWLILKHLRSYSNPEVSASRHSIPVMLVDEMCPV